MALVRPTVAVIIKEWVSVLTYFKDVLKMGIIIFVMLYLCIFSNYASLGILAMFPIVFARIPTANQLPLELAVYIRSQVYKACQLRA